MIQSIYSKEEMDSKDLGKENTAFKMPKNIRQIGQVDLTKKIYAEDYVMTYIKQLAEKTVVGERKAVLLGQYIKTEGSRHIFINGAVEIIENEENERNTETMFSNEVWTEIYDCIKKYFTNVEIVGWYITKKDGPFDVDEHITKMHLDNFSGQDKTLLVYDPIEKEEAFYFYDKGKLKKQTGYYIYYERNEEMQNYMVENKENTSTDDGYVDLATQKIRKVIEEKNEASKQKSLTPLVYTASSLLAVVVLVIGATMVNNYNKTKDADDTVAVLSDSVMSQEADSGVSSDVTQVETVPSTIIDQDVSTDNSKDTTDMTANSGIDNADVQAMIEENEAAKSDEPNQKKENENKDSDKSKKEDTTSSNDKKVAAKEETTTKDTTKENNNKKDGQKDSEKSKETTSSSEQTIAVGSKYTVKKGDTLVSISTKVYGTLKGVETLQKANNIDDQDLIYEGQIILIPEYK